LLEDISSGQSRQAGILRAAGTLGTMAIAAGHDGRLIAVEDDIGKRRVIVRVPIGRDEAVFHLTEGQGDGAVRDVAQGSIVLRLDHIGRIDRVSPRRRHIAAGSGRGLGSL